jgi:hypothetical protein
MTWPEPGGLATRVEQISLRYRPVASQHPWLDRLGYARADAFDQSTYVNMKKVLNAGVGQVESVFDFSNEPGFYYYLLQYQPSTRYYHVQLAIREDTQADLLVELRRHPPALVIYSNERYGPSTWDYIPNEVRHYDVSQWILDNYRPWLISDTQVVYARGDRALPRIPDGLEPTPISTDVVFRGAPTCDWAYAPNFFSVVPGRAAPDRPGMNLHVATRTTGVDVLTAPSGTRWTDYQWLELKTAGGFHDDALALSDQTNRDPHHEIRFRTTIGSSQRYLVRVGSCPQWHTYPTGPLFLIHGLGDAIASAQLVP